MNDIITLGKKLSEMFFENYTEYDLEKNRERLNDLQNQIKTLEEKLQNDNNYKSEFSNEVSIEYNKQIINANNSIDNLKNNINETNEMIKMAEEEIIDLNNQINNINVLILDKIKKRREETDINVKSNLQTEIDSLIEERSRTKNEIETLVEDKEYFSNSLVSLREDFNSQNEELKKVQEEKKHFESEILSQLRAKDEKLLDGLKIEYDSLSGIINDLYKIIDLFELVDKMENNKNIDLNELNSVMNNLKDLYFINNLIKKKEKQVSELEEKVQDLNNYKEDSLEKYNKRKSKYDLLKTNALQQLNIIENQISQFEKIEGDIKLNLKNQRDLNNEILELGRKLRTGEISGEEFDKEVKGYRDRLDFLKKQEEGYKKYDSAKQLSELNLQRQKIQNRINELEGFLIKFSPLKNKEYNKFKLYTDQEKIAVLKSEIKSLNSMIDISSRVENILRESNKLTNKNSADLTDNKVENNNQFQNLNNDDLAQDLNNNDTPKYFDATKLDLNDAEDLQKIATYIQKGYDIITDPEDERLKNLVGHSSNLDNNSKDLNDNINQVNSVNDPYVNLDPKKASIPFNATPDNNNTLHNVTNVKKSSKFAEIKEKIKGNLPKIISLVLCGVATIGAGAIVGCSKINSKDLEQSINDNIASEVAMQDATLSLNINFNNLYKTDLEQGLSLDNILEHNGVQDNISQDNVVEEKDNYVSENAMETMEVKHIQIGDAVKFTGDKIYLTSKEANKEENGLMPYFSNENIRTISAIQYVSPDGNDYITITEKNKDKGLELSKLGYQVESVCLKEGATTYEGWINLKDMEVTNGKVRH